MEPKYSLQRIFLFLYHILLMFFQLFYIVPLFSNPDDSTTIKVLVICLVVNFKIMGI